MRFFRNYANYALRAELCDFASVHNSGRSALIWKLLTGIIAEDAYWYLHVDDWKLLPEEKKRSPQKI